LCLGIANISARATWHAVEDGVLWTAQADGVVASDIARGTSAAAVGIRRGDLLLAIDDRPVQQVADIEQLLQGAAAGQTARYTILRLGTREVVDVRIAPIPSGPRALYFFLAAVGIFTLVVGAAVRLRRPRFSASRTSSRSRGAAAAPPHRCVRSRRSTGSSSSTSPDVSSQGSPRWHAR
jgi:membrane-associated protease RseP (regulator of RpoE activity)